MDILNLPLKAFYGKGILVFTFVMALTACDGELESSSTSSSGGISSSSSSSASSSSSSSSSSGGSTLGAFARGRSAYVTQCAKCHGPDGSGALGTLIGGPIDNHQCPRASRHTPDLDCSNVTSLAKFLNDRMPLGEAETCVDSASSTCATDIAIYMIQAFVTNDRDRDGITDDKDKCPNTLAKDISTIDADGCQNAGLGLVIAVNVGGSAYTAKNGIHFLADDPKYRNVQGINSGQATTEVANTEDDPIYTQGIYVLKPESLRYSFELPNGFYKAVLHFAEFEHDAVGKRIFNVSFNRYADSGPILNNYDVFEKSGGKGFAVVEQSSLVAVIDGRVTISIRPRVGNASLNGIEIWGVSQNDGDQDGVVDVLDGCPGTAFAASVNREGCSEAQRDADGDGILVPVDVCPKTPAIEIATIANSGSLAGCSEQEQQDDDGDGVPDVVDQCLNTAPSEKVGRTGCSGIVSLPSGDIVSPQFRLTEREYQSTVKDAFGVTSLAKVAFLRDSTGPFWTYVNNASDRTNDFSALVLAAESLAKDLAGNYANKCDWAAKTRDCVNEHLSTPLKMLYRLSSLANGDLQAIADIIKEASEAGATTEEAVGTGIASILIDPRMVYRLEKGDTNSAAGVAGVDLTPQEFANRFAYLLTDSAPDADLSNTLDNLLGNQGNITYQFERLKSTDRYGEAVWDFVSHWLGIAELARANPDTLERAALEETRRFVQYVLVEGNGTLEDLFTANYSFINQTLADHYGVSAPDVDWQRYTFPEEAKRTGIFTHASFLTANGEHDRADNRFFRGKIVFEKLFCDRFLFGDPAGSQEGEPVPDRIVEPSCKSCHAEPERIGYVFDEYDRDGKKYPSAERLGSLSMDTDIDGTFIDVLDFGRQLSGSHAMTHCLTRQLYRFALGRDAYASEQASFDQVRETLNETLSLNDAIQTFLSTQSFAKVYDEPQIEACPR